MLYHSKESFLSTLTTPVILCGRQSPWVQGATAHDILCPHGQGQVRTALTPSSISTTRPLHAPQRGKVSLDRGDGSTCEGQDLPFEGCSPLGRNPTPQGLQVSGAPPSTIPRSSQVKVRGEKLSFSHLREEQPLVSLASSGSEGDKLISSSLKEG